MAASQNGVHAGGGGGGGFSASLLTRFGEDYYRNQKRGGVKHMRCFPHHGGENNTHKKRGFCGATVEVAVRAPPRSAGEGRLWVVGVFEEKKKDPSVCIGATVPVARARKELLRTSEHPLHPWYRARRRGDGEGNAVCQDPDAEVYEMNWELRGWHYGWKGDRASSSREHVLRVFVFEERENGSSLLCRALTHSTAFHVLSQRRSKKRARSPSSGSAGSASTDPSFAGRCVQKSRLDSISNNSSAWTPALGVNGTAKGPGGRGGGGGVPPAEDVLSVNSGRESFPDDVEEIMALNADGTFSMVPITPSLDDINQFSAALLDQDMTQTTDDDNSEDAGMSSGMGSGMDFSAFSVGGSGDQAPRLWRRMPSGEYMVPCGPSQDISKANNVLALDTNGDGRTDTLAPRASFDAGTPGSAEPSKPVGVDTTGNGRVDSIAMDTTGDGRLDTMYDVSGGVSGGRALPPIPGAGAGAERRRMFARSGQHGNSAHSLGDLAAAGGGSFGHSRGTGMMSSFDSKGSNASLVAALELEIAAENGGLGMYASGMGVDEDNREMVWELPAYKAEEAAAAVAVAAEGTSRPVASAPPARKRHSSTDGMAEALASMGLTSPRNPPPPAAAATQAQAQAQAQAQKGRPKSKPGAVGAGKEAPSSQAEERPPATRPVRAMLSSEQRATFYEAENEQKYKHAERAAVAEVEGGLTVHDYIVRGNLEMVQSMVRAGKGTEAVDAVVVADCAPDPPVLVIAPPRAGVHLSGGGTSASASAAAAAFRSSSPRPGTTPLHTAAFHGRLSICRFLVQSGGADANARDRRGLTPLHMAAHNGRIDVCRFLVCEAGADVWAVEAAEGRTAFQLAMRYNQHALCQWFVAHLAVRFEKAPPENWSFVKVTKSNREMLHGWNVVGCRVAVRRRNPTKAWWNRAFRRKSWYNGTITKYDEFNRELKVAYDCGVVRWERLDFVRRPNRHRLMVHPSQVARFRGGGSSNNLLCGSSNGEPLTCTETTGDRLIGYVS